MREMTRVILADDHPLFYLSALELSLEAAGVEVVGTSGTGDKVLEPGREMAAGCGLARSRDAGHGWTDVRDAARGRRTRTCGWSSSRRRTDPNTIREVLTAGAVCFVGKSVQPSDLVHALRAVTKTDGIHYRGDCPPRSSTGLFPAGRAGGSWPDEAGARDPAARRPRVHQLPSPRCSG